MLYLRALKKNIYFLAIALVALIFSCTIWRSQPLIVPLPMHGFIDASEFFVPFVLILPISFLLYDNYEIELGLTCGVKTTRLMFAKFISVLLYAILAALTMVSLYKHEAYLSSDMYEEIIPVYVPENFKVYMAVSAVVTTLFFASLFLLARVATKNCYAPVGLGVLIYTVFSTINEDIHNGYRNIWGCLFDPFLSNYVIGDKVLTEQLGVGPLWTCNRLLFLGLSVAMLGITYVLLRREKLHQGFND